MPQVEGKTRVSKRIQLGQERYYPQTRHSSSNRPDMKFRSETLAGAIHMVLGSVPRHLEKDTGRGAKIQRDEGYARPKVGDAHHN
jgi:hypothetical protein